MKKGFTLIELLIVIAVLGILAAGILATIDPFEQFRKARDTNARNTVVEVYNAYIRYNANHGTWPWQAAAPGACTAPNQEGLTTTVGGACLSALIGDGELKTGFTAAIGSGNAITSAVVTFMSGSATQSETVAVCFLPDSKTMKKDSNTKYTNAGVGTCSNATESCYWCAL